MGRYIYSDDEQVTVEVTGWSSRQIADLMGNALNRGYIGTGSSRSTSGDSSREWLAFSRATHAVYCGLPKELEQVVELAYYPFPWPTA